MFLELHGYPSRTFRHFQFPGLRQFPPADGANLTVSYRDPNEPAKTFELIPERPLEIGPQSSPLQISLATLNGLRLVN